ncbi:MAG: cell division protein ZapE [Actinomycetales bacterium]
MPDDATSDLPRLVDRTPQVPVERLLAELVPPPRFDKERFGTYRPDPSQPSQAEAVRRLEAFAGELGGAGDGRRGNGGRGNGGERGGRRSLFRRKREAAEARGVYLDGGFGVGKTHLLASLWHAAPEPKSFATFVELTNLVGALGFAEAVEALSSRTLLAIDEFELDDPGDTVLVSTLLTRLAESGVALAATSNTLPGALGEGRFAAEDFLREIQGLSARFDVVRIDGEDYRHRGLPEPPEPLTDAEVDARVAEVPGATADDFDALLAHLATLHPSRYGALLDGVPLVGLRGLSQVPDQNVALRLVVLVDRLYDRSVPVVASGERIDRLFSEEMLRGGYRKKYFRAVSRLGALAREGE